MGFSEEKASANTPRFTLHPSVVLSDVAAQLPYTYTGADFYALCTDAMLKAVTRQAALVDARVRALNAAREADGERAVSTAYFFDHFATEDDLSVLVMEADFVEAQGELVPSVSAGELAHYERVRNSFEGQRGGEGGEVRSPEKGKGVRNSFDGQRGEVKSPIGKGKGVAGKGRGRADGFPPGFSDEEEEGEVVGGVNGRAKGKGKAVAGFGDGTSDDEGLY